MVTSGAVAAGYSMLKLDKSKQIGRKALAAAGQPILMSSYKRKFGIYDIEPALILVIGGLIGVMVTTMLLPIFSLNLQQHYWV